MCHLLFIFSKYICGRWTFSSLHPYHMGYYFSQWNNINWYDTTLTKIMRKFGEKIEHFCQKERIIILLIIFVSAWGLLCSSMLYVIINLTLQIRPHEGHIKQFLIICYDIHSYGNTSLHPSSSTVSSQGKLLIKDNVLIL